MAGEQSTDPKRPVKADDSDTDLIDEALEGMEAEPTEGELVPEEQPADAEIEVAAQLAFERDRVLRLQAEMENLRSRTAREIAEHQRYAAMPLVRDLLPVVDNVERAIGAAQQSGDTTSLLEGFQLVHQQLLTVLQQHHCRPIVPQGEPFDPQYHEAILQQPNAEVPAHHVAHVAQVGYVLHDRVVRPAQVIISSGPAQDSQP